MSTNNMNRFEFRCIRPEETQQAIEIEQICFPPNEACSPKSLTERIKATAETFLVAEDKETGKLAAFLNGVPTDEDAFRDEFFTDISLINPEGKNIMLLGLDVRPEYRMQGLGRELVSRYSQREAQKGRKKLFLTCLDEKGLRAETVKRLPYLAGRYDEALKKAGMEKPLFRQGYGRIWNLEEE